MEAEDSLDMPVSKVGSRSSRSRSTSSSKEVTRSEVDESGDSKSPKSEEKDLPNDKEHLSSSRDEKTEQDVREEGEEDEQEDEEAREDEEEASESEDVDNSGRESPDNGDRDSPTVEEEDNVGAADQEPSKDTSDEDEAVDEKPVEDLDTVDKKPVDDEDTVDVKPVIKEENPDVPVKEESNSEDAADSDCSSGQWKLNIDTSGSSGRSEQNASEKGDVEEEGSKPNPDGTSVNGGDVELRANEICDGIPANEEHDERPESPESFIGFVEETSDTHNILKKIIENLEEDGTAKEVVKNANTDDWEMSSEVAGPSNMPQAVTSTPDPLINHEGKRKRKRSRKLSSDSFIYDSEFTGRLAGGNSTDMASNEDLSSKSFTNSPSTNVSFRGKKGHVDVTNPAFRKPMEYGWKRELVYRNTADASGTKRMADIYYYTPAGKKVRSNREVMDSLVGTDLTPDNFTFFKEPLGLDDPDKEIIRYAKRTANKEPFGAPPRKVMKLSKTSLSPAVKEEKMDEEPAAVTERVNSKPARVLLPKEPTPPVEEAASAKILGPFKPKPRGFARIKVTPLRNQRKSLGTTSNSTTANSTAANSTPPPKPTPPTRSKKESGDSGELEMGMLPPMWKDPTVTPIVKKTAFAPSGTTNNAIASSAAPTGVKTLIVTKAGNKIMTPITRPVTSSSAVSLLNKKPASTTSQPTAVKIVKKVESPCTIQCVNMMGIIPSLQCRVCLCLYHPECVGLGPITDVIHSYVCKKCQQALKENKTTTPVSSSLKITSTTPPPLTPIISSSSTKSTVGTVACGLAPTTSSSIAPPKLQNLPSGEGSGKLQTVKREPESEEVKAKKLESERLFMQFFMQNVAALYGAMGQVFQYLKVQELLRASRVCRMWRDLALKKSLWATVRLKNSQVVSWEGCAAALRRFGTEELDLRKMLIPGKANAMWEEFCSVIGTVPSLRRLELCKCSAEVLDRIAQECPQLQSLTALSIKCSSISLNFVKEFSNLQELRLKSTQGIDLSCSLDVLKHLKNLKHLSVTTFREFGRKDPNVIGSITSLETLELGDFCDFPESFGESLTNLTNLQRLRLEKGQGKMCPTFKVLAGIQTLPKLTQLELVNFDIKPGFDVALEQCTNIKRLLIIPTYVSQSATTNHMVLGGVTKLGDSLEEFVWGVTHELLRVTELFVDQCEGQKGGRPPPKDIKKNGCSDSIPVLKPVPGLTLDAISENGIDNKNADSKQKSNDSANEENKTSAATQQVDILPLSKLQSLLTLALPKTKVKILKIPFHATWRQSIGEHSH